MEEMQPVDLKKKELTSVLYRYSMNQLRTDTQPTK